MFDKYLRSDGMMTRRVIRLNHVMKKLDSILGNLHTKYIRQANNLRRKGADADCIQLKESMQGKHGRYTELGNYLSNAGFLDLSLRVYSELERTVYECRRITGSKHFNIALALHNQGIRYFLQRNHDRGIALIQLASKEDRKIKHHGQAEKDLKNMLDVVCGFIRGVLRGDPNFDHLDPKKLVRRLREDEKFRLVGIVYNFSNGLKDTRSLAVRDIAETNIMRTCKLTETYLKRKLKLAKTLNPLIQDAFKNNPAKCSRIGNDWYQDWCTNWLKGGYTKYETHRDDNKIQLALNSQDDSVAKAFKLLTLLRNFTAHIYNEKSILFKRYDECFKLCLRALTYTISYV